MKQFAKLSPLALGIVLGIGLVACGAPLAVAGAPVNAVHASHANVLRATLKNGLNVVVIRNTLAPVVTTQMTYKVGGYETPEGFPGDAHALEHMMFRGSKGLSSAQLFEMAGKMGAMYDAFTTEDATQYYFVAPSQYVGLLLKIGSLRMRGLDLTQKNWSAERGAIEQEVSRDMSNPGFLASLDVEKDLFAGTGYSHDPLGTRPSFNKTPAAALQKFYDKWYQPNNALLVIAGDVDPQKTLAEVKQLFGPIPRGDVPVRKPVHLEPFQPETIARNTPAASGTVEFIYRLPGERSQDYAALQVLMDVLNNPRSHLSGLAASGKTLGSGAFARSFAYAGTGSILADFPKGGDAKATQADLQGVIDQLRENGVSASLVAAAKLRERVGFESQRDSARGLASSWSQALAWQGLDSPQAALDQIEKVTPADVDRVFREYFKNSQRVTVVMTPNPNGKPPSHSRGPGGKEHFDHNEKLNPPLPEWASKALTKLEVPRSTLSPVRMKLANGITLIVQPEHISKMITVFGHIDHNDDLQAPVGQQGIGSLLNRLFKYGTVKLDRSAFHEALDKVGAQERAGSSFVLSALGSDFDTGMKLLAANELHPALPQTAFDVQQKSVARMLVGMFQSPGYKAARARVEMLLPADDPRLRQATPATINRLTLADVKQYFAQTYRPDLTTIVVVGDVTPALAKSEVEKYFGAWKAVGPKPDVVLKQVPLNKAGHAVVPNKYASQDQVTMVEQLDLNMYSPAHYALELGNQILGGNGFASRLMADIRVRHGYVYGVGSNFSFDRTRSEFSVSYGSDPDKVGNVNQLVYKNINEMRTVPVSPSELLDAKQAEIRSIPLRLASINAIGGQLLFWSYMGLPLDEPTVVANHYLHVSAKQVQEAFKKYVDPARLVHVVEGPTPTKH